MTYQALYQMAAASFSGVGQEHVKQTLQMP